MIFYGMLGCYTIALTATTGLTRCSGIYRLIKFLSFIRTVLLRTSRLFDLGSGCGLSFLGDGLITALGT